MLCIFVHKGREVNPGDYASSGKLLTTYLCMYLCIMCTLYCCLSFFSSCMYNLFIEMCSLKLN